MSKSTGQGNRTDLTLVTDMVKKRGFAALDEIAAAHANQFVKFHKGLTALAHQLDTPRKGVVQRRVLVLFGPSRGGKTTIAHAMAEAAGEELYVAAPADGPLWIDGCNSAKWVLLDDYGPKDGGQYKFNVLLRMLDHFDQRFPTKGSFQPWKPDVVLITSNYHPALWYPAGVGGTDNYDALRNRITECCFVGDVKLRSQLDINAYPTWGAVQNIESAEVWIAAHPPKANAAADDDAEGETSQPSDGAAEVAPIASGADDSDQENGNGEACPDSGDGGSGRDAGAPMSDSE